MRYLERALERELLAELPLEARLRNVPEDRIIARLKAERGQAEARGAKLTPLTVFVLADHLDRALARSIYSLALQSSPALRCVLVHAPSLAPDLLDLFITELDIAPKHLTTATPENVALPSEGFVTFLRHGDRLHPSAAAWLDIACAAPDAPDVIAWGEHQPKGPREAAWLQRNPPLHKPSLLHFPYLRNAFAVRAASTAAYSGDLFAEVRDNDLHLFQIWLSQQNLRWSAHPEFFLIRADKRLRETPLAAARRAYAGREAQYAAAFGKQSEFTLQAAPADAPQPYVLIPKQRAGKISVVIPFRDKPELTLRAVTSVAAQSAAGRCDIVLIDNQSSAEALDALNAGLAALHDAPAVRIVPYPLPFNHSAQCNLGVRESSGDVIVLMNNDCELLTADALEQMSAWALVREIATVGAAIRDPESGRVAAGLEARLAPVHYFDSMVEERSEADFTPFVRETFGNTFALAAISRATYQKLGPLDDARFPNGFNDVEYACRASAQNMKHLVLGHILAQHAPGASRARVDETPQKILLRTLYPSFATASLSELRFDDVIAAYARPLGAPVPAKGPAGPPPPPRPFLQRMAGRLAQTQIGQRVLANPAAYALLRRAYKTVVK